MKNVIRQLTRNEIPQVWDIDRTELIEKLYVLKEGKLLLSEQRFDMKGWPEGEAEHYTPVLLESFDRGAPFWGIFEHDRLVARQVLIRKNAVKMVLYFNSLFYMLATSNVGKV